MTTKQLTWWQKWIAEKVGIIDYNFDKAIKWHRATAKREEREQAQKEHPDCLSCPLYQQAQKQPASYEPPSPNTDPKLQARLEALRRKQDMMAFLHLDDSRELPKVSGKLGKLYEKRKLSES